MWQFDRAATSITSGVNRFFHGPFANYVRRRRCRNNRAAIEAQRVATALAPFGTARLCHTPATAKLWGSAACRGAIGHAHDAWSMRSGSEVDNLTISCDICFGFNINFWLCYRYREPPPTGQILQRALLAPNGRPFGEKPDEATKPPPFGGG
jgi:hypothetical protein